MKRWLVTLIVALNVAFLFVLTWRLVAVPENHWGFDHRWSLAIWGAEWLAVLFGKSLTARERAALLLTSGCCILVVAISIYANGLLPYELWIKRGMPGKWS